jgi:hypothetical protein
MNDQWKHLALYHYSSVPTLTSACSVCGLHPKANKSLYVRTFVSFIKTVTATPVRLKCETRSNRCY